MRMHDRGMIALAIAAGASSIDARAGRTRAVGAQALPRIMDPLMRRGRVALACPETDPIGYGTRMILVVVAVRA